MKELRPNLLSDPVVGGIVWKCFWRASLQVHQTTRLTDQPKRVTSVVAALLGLIPRELLGPDPRLVHTSPMQ